MGFGLGEVVGRASGGVFKNLKGEVGELFLSWPGMRSLFYMIGRE